MQKYYQYLNNILSGKVNHGKHIKVLCESIKRDLDFSEDYFFDEEQASKYIRLIENLYFSEGSKAYTKVKLEDWQCFIIGNIFGWKRKANGFRRYSDATIHIPKKNGKSFSAAAIAIANAIIDKEAAGQIYLAATSREQAGIVFKAVKRTISSTPNLGKYFRVMQHAVIYNQTDTTIKALSSEVSNAEGLGSSLVIFDEYHLQKTDELKENLISGQAGRTQPLFISISTAGTNRNSPYYKHILKCKSILSGVIKNDNHFVAIYEADGDDWTNPKTWEQANPNFGISVMPDFIKKECAEAKNSPSKEPYFKTKHLNIWTDAHTTWIPHEDWMKCGKDLKLEDFRNCDAWGGLDLASSRDFTALSIIIKRDGKFYLFVKFWIPEDMAEKRTIKDKILFTDWAKQGWITLTDGNVTDYTHVKNDIYNISKIVRFRKLAYDPANASELVVNLTDLGLPMHEYTQGIMNMSPPTKRFERMIYNGELIHERNPVMSWMMGNVQIFQDANDNRKPHKGKSTDKIDGVVSALNGLGAYMFDEANSSNFWVV